MITKHNIFVATKTGTFMSVQAHSEIGSKIKKSLNIQTAIKMI